MVRFGVIGCGTISAIFMEAVAKQHRATVTGVFDANVAHGRDFAAAHGAICYPTVEQLLHADIDAVYIGTPSGLHAEYAVKAANAGKHIMVEKPLGITLAQLDDIAEACAANRVKLCAVSQLAFSDGYETVQKAVDEGRLGKIFLADLSMKYYRSDAYYKAGGWHGTWAFDGGGALMNQGIHGIGLLLGLFGPPRSVTALTRTFVHPIEVEDTAVAIVEFQSGAIGSIVATTSVKSGMPRVLCVHGTKGTVTLTESSITQWDIEKEESPMQTDRPICSPSSVPTNMSSEFHRRQLVDFVDALETGRQPRLGIAEGRMQVELILGIYRSSQMGKTVYFQPR